MQDYNTLMDAAPLNMPGYRIHEYRLVLNPHEELWQRIVKLKDEFAEKFRLSPAQHVKPNITLVSFLSWEMMEEKIIHRLRQISMGVAPFKVELKDFGSAPTHSIFINVVSKLPIQGLVNQLKEAQRVLKLNNEHKPHFMDDPHINIAFRLKPWQYEQGWLEFSNRQFTGRFIADNLLLLKRPTGTKSAFQIARRFEFMNLAVTNQQGNLFL